MFRESPPASPSCTRSSTPTAASGSCGENSALATSDVTGSRAGRSAMRKGSASGAAHGERAPVSWAKITVADFGGTGVSDCAAGNTARGTSGSNPSRSATIYVFDITYALDLQRVEFSPLSRRLWRMHFSLTPQRRFPGDSLPLSVLEFRSRLSVVRVSLIAWSPGTIFRSSRLRARRQFFRGIKGCPWLKRLCALRRSIVWRGAQSVGAGDGFVRAGLSGYANPSAAL